MYNQIPAVEYSEYTQRLISDIKHFYFDDMKFFGQYNFNITYHTLLFFLYDYAAFLAHSNKWKDVGNNMDSIHLGLKVAQDFVSFWDHIGFQFNIIFELDIKERDVFFKPAADAICRKYNGGLKSKTVKMELLYQKEKSLRDNYRNPFTHRVHEVFFRADSNETIKDKLLKLSNILEKSYMHIIGAFKLYYDIIHEYCPHKEYGSYPK